MDLKGQEILRRIRRLKMDFGCTVNAAVRTPKQKTPHGAGLFTSGGAKTNHSNKLLQSLETSFWPLYGIRKIMVT
jgi:hypothetical protein